MGSKPKDYNSFCGYSSDFINPDALARLDVWAIRNLKHVARTIVGETTAKPKDSQPVRVAIVGASVMRLIRDDVEDALKAIGKDKGYHPIVSNWSIPITSTDLTAPCADIGASYIKANKPDVVLIVLGGNDALTVTDPQAIKENLLKIMDIYRHKLPDAQIGLVGLTADGIRNIARHIYEAKKAKGQRDLKDPEAYIQAVERVYQEIYNQYKDDPKFHFLPSYLSGLKPEHYVLPNDLSTFSWESLFYPYDKHYADYIVKQSDGKERGVVHPYHPSGQKFLGEKIARFLDSGPIAAFNRERQVQEAVSALQFIGVPVDEQLKEGMRRYLSNPKGDKQEQSRIP